MNSFNYIKHTVLFLRVWEIINDSSFLFERYKDKRISLKNVKCTFIS